MFPELNFDDIGDVGAWRPDPTALDGPVRLQRRADQADGHAQAQGRRRLPPARHRRRPTAQDGHPRRSFTFDRLFTSRNGWRRQRVREPPARSPVDGSVPLRPGEGEWYTRYYGGYVQDDWRVNSKFTVNYGVRLEHEAGLPRSEPSDGGLRSRRDQPARRAGAQDRHAARGPHAPRRPDLCRRRRRPDEQGDLPAIKVAPRVGVTYFAQPQDTVLRGGYGTF